jgi:hypothetical protein
MLQGQVATVRDAVPIELAYDCQMVRRDTEDGALVWNLRTTTSVNPSCAQPPRATP